VRLSRCTLTSQGSDLALESDWHELMVFGSAREGARSSSFNWAGGAAHGIEPGSTMDHFGMADMLRALTRQLQPRGLGSKFVGTVVLTPWAVSSLLDWLLTQLGDTALIGGSSLLAGRVGQGVASPLLGVQSRFDAPGVVPWSADACVARPVQVMSRGQLLTLLPSLYGARRTGHPHCPVAATGWAIDAGETPLAGMTAGVARGALVGRLSMGDPAPNGDFSGVIKNSFVIRDGRQGPALAETMINGNVAQMLKDVLAVSAERIDSGTDALPWLRVGGLHFS
jgi:PmbA protein